MSRNHWLNDVIEKAGSTQASVAKEAGITQSHISKIATGATRPSVNVAKKIAAALGFDWTRFYLDSDS